MAKGVSVVVPTRGLASHLDSQLIALTEQEWTGELEVIVSLNGPDRGTGHLVAAAAEAGLSVRIVDASARLGASGARNVGVAASRHSLVLACDDDDVVAKDWVRLMAEAACQADLVGGSLDLEALNTSDARYWSGRVPSGVDLPVTCHHLPYVVGCNFGAWKAVLAQLGGWDEGFESGSEDVDLSWRALAAGYKLAYVDDAVVAYRLRTRVIDVFRQQLNYGRSNVLLYRNYRASGMPPRGVKLAMYKYLWLVAHIGYLSRRRTAGRWAASFGSALGRAVGSVEYRTWYL